METRICRLYAANDIRIEAQPLADPGPGEVLVAVGAGGICGSDLHYFQDGGFGPIRVREPIILGHEAAGRVLACGAGVAGPAPGTLVAINPSRPCGACRYCAEGLTTHCLEMRFAGSAMRLPHEQGLFRERIVVDAAQCHAFGPGTEPREAACAEPLAVCLHARRMAGDLRGRRVLVTGAGPIGALCTAVAAEAGAQEVVTTDLQDLPLDIARRMGAGRTVNVARDGAAMAAFAADKGHFDVAFECSAAAPAIRGAIAALRPQGRLVQVGVTGDVPLPVNALVGKEITYQGTQRFLPEDFAEAVAMIAARRIDVRPMVTGSYPLEAAAEAFACAGDRSRAVKVHLSFGAD
ncbi:alcohol dehydrogenase catalytic domain-containing protein [Rhodobacteraceae bacterium 2CG4]|uniref:Alcohol dehydrogenase catalytic domain-containing protein n=1 Tax=Halovulum marinum TaxID=2662447 RepID=A0A6L5Z2D0_9RHOB|nr:L-idonate 5-dehydrogenase [Halovulum marinum]MSU90726.1 alcohol dehydrogenase catalytic domain-containing protein [Halovulum marinum]